MQTICCACKFIGRPQAFKTTRPAEALKSYYLVCEEGHIECKECVSLNDHDEKFCHLGDSPHPKWPQKIECLLHNKDSILLDRLSQHFHKLQANRKQIQVELQRWQEQFQNQKRRFYVGDRDRQQYLALNNINIQIFEDAPMASIGVDTDHLQKQISQFSQKIRKQQRKSGYFKLVFDSLASTIVLAAIPLQTITIVYFFNQDSQAISFLLAFSIILGIYYLSFLFVILQQACHQYRQNLLRLVLSILFALTGIIPLLPILVALSLPFNTLQKINQRPFDKYYPIPKNTPCVWKLNHSFLILKTVLYWIILIKYGIAYRDPYQQAAFILSFFQVASLIYLNLRYNNDKQLLQKIRKQHLS